MIVESVGIWENVFMDIVSAQAGTETRSRTVSNESVMAGSHIVISYATVLPERERYTIPALSEANQAPFSRIPFCLVWESM